MLRWIKAREQEVDAFTGLLLVINSLGLYFGYPHHFSPFHPRDIAVASVILLIAAAAAILPWLRRTVPAHRYGMSVNASIAGTLIALSFLHY